jgi:3'(2'), 5'-bisphosphate nucleotidase
MQLPLSKKQINDIIAIAHKTALVIMNFYENKNAKVYVKDDNSNVTDADHAANSIISEGLLALFPDVPVISEESNSEENLYHFQNANLFWLVDPLDATYAFVNRRGIFSINIALIENGKPVFGLIYSPKHMHCYYSQDDHVVRLRNGKKTKFYYLPKQTSVFDFFISSQQLDAFTQECISKYNLGIISQASSAYKYCLMAEGRADIFPRFRRTSAWDTAAGQAILNAIGGEIYDDAGRVLTYKGRSTLYNPPFIAYRDKSFKL